MTDTTRTATPTAADIHRILTERNQIAIIWDIEDVQSLRPELTDEQAWQVLENAARHHDAGIGINWEVLEATAECLFPEAIDDPDQ